MLTLRGIMYHILLFNIFRPWEVGMEKAPCAFPMFHMAGASLVLIAGRYGAQALLIRDARGGLKRLRRAKVPVVEKTGCRHD